MSTREAAARKQVFVAHHTEGRTASALVGHLLHGADPLLAVPAPFQVANPSAEEFKQNAKETAQDEQSANSRLGGGQLQMTSLLDGAPAAIIARRFARRTR